MRTNAPLSRRALLAAVGNGLPLLPVLVACAGHAMEAPPPTDVDGVEISPSSVIVRLSRVPALSVPGGILVIFAAGVIVVHRAPGEYRAFSNVCTHAGCGIAEVVGPRVRCRCHGSEFDLDGVNVAGPAPSPLRRLPATIEESGTVLRIDRAGRSSFTRDARPVRLASSRAGGLHEPPGAGTSPST
jgi:nitrite reductase/ring-hydroxylating ferredoxin subunit